MEQCHPIKFPRCLNGLILRLDFRRRKIAYLLREWNIPLVLLLIHANCSGYNAGVIKTLSYKP